jgi:hypothetical protein
LHWLLVGTLLALLTVALLLLVTREGVLTGVPQVVMIVSGMTAMAALTAFQRFVESDKGSPLIPVTFNETLLSTYISEGLPTFQPPPSEKPPPWELSADQLVGTDNAVALVRLHIDIERQLRRIAHAVRVDLATRPAGAVGLARELVGKEVLPVTFLEPLQKITQIRNLSVHGADISDNVAAAVVRVGNQLLERLRGLPAPFKQGQ